jgi:hypothetical protein
MMLQAKSSDQHIEKNNDDDGHDSPHRKTCRKGTAIER